MSTKLAEVEAKMTSDVKKDTEVKVILRVNWTDKSKEVAFKPAIDLNHEDKIRVIVEKL